MENSPSQKPLRYGRHSHRYVFLHIPKTAGATLRSHLLSTFKSQQSLGIASPDGKQITFQWQQQKIEFNDQLSAEQWLQNQNPDQLSQIQFIYGHWITERFLTPFHTSCRLITFLRNPLDRTVSTYEHIRERSLNASKNNPKLQILNASNQMMEFNEWLETVVSAQNFMTRFLLERFQGKNLPNELSEFHLEQAKQLLDRFYFVGLTESFAQDSHYLYGLMGVGKSLPDKNRQSNRIVDRHSPSTKMLIQKYCALDEALYQYAKMLNQKFKDAHSEFALLSQKSMQKHASKKINASSESKVSLRKKLKSQHNSKQLGWTLLNFVLSQKKWLKSAYRCCFTSPRMRRDHRETLSRLLSGKKVLILGTGPSVNQVQYIPKDTVVLTCKLGLKLYESLLSDTPIALFLCWRGAMKEGKGIAPTLPYVKPRILLTDDKRYMQNNRFSKGNYQTLLEMNRNDAFYLKHTLKPTRLHQIIGPNKKLTSSGIILLQLALYYKAQAIYLAGIDMNEEGYFWGGKNKNRHQHIDRNYVETISKKYKHVYSATEISPITKYLPYKPL